MDTPTQKVKNEFSGRNSQGIYPNLDYFGMILKALQTLLFKIKIHPSLKKTPKILGIQPRYNGNIQMRLNTKIGSGLKWTVLGQSGRSRGVKLDGPND